MLRCAVVGRVEHLPRQADGVTGRIEGGDQLIKKGPLFPDSEPLHIFEDERASPQLRDDADELKDQAVARVFKRPLADERESLAGRAAEDAINRPVSDSRQQSNLRSTKSDHRARDDRCLREVELVDGAMDGIDLHGRSHVKARLLEAEREPASPGE